MDLSEKDGSGESEIEEDIEAVLAKLRRPGGKIGRPIVPDSEEEVEVVEVPRVKRKRETVAIRTPSPSPSRPVDTGKSFSFAT